VCYEMREKNIKVEETKQVNPQEIQGIRGLFRRKKVANKLFSEVPLKEQKKEFVKEDQAAEEKPEGKLYKKSPRIPLVLTSG